MATRSHATKAIGETVEGETVVAPQEPNALEVFIEHQRKALAEAGKALTALFPTKVQTHGEAAIRESVEGYRTLVNSTLDEIISVVQGAKIESTEAKETEAKEKA